MAAVKKKASAARTAQTNKVARGRTTEENIDDEEREIEGAEASGESTPFDYASFFKENGLSYTEEDLIDISSLVPIYSFEHAFNEEWPPACGKLLNRVELEVAKNETDPKQRWRMFYIMEVEAATKALAGIGDDRETNDVDPGGYILIPESGALKNRDRLKIAAVDPEKVHKAIFRVSGEPIDLGKPGRNPMWPVDAFLIGEPIPRTGRYALENTNRESTNPNRKNGTPELPAGGPKPRVVGAGERLVGNA
jgi:hypothetical protein